MVPLGEQRDVVEREVERRKSFAWLLTMQGHGGHEAVQDLQRLEAVLETLKRLETAERQL